METVDIIDYAMPLMRIERTAKEIHELCLNRKYVEAQQIAQNLCVESRLLQHVLHIMDKKEEP